MLAHDQQQQRNSGNRFRRFVGSGLNFSSFTLENINFKVKANPNGAGPEIGGGNGKNCLGFSAWNCDYTLDTLAPAFVIPTRDISGFETPETGLGASYIMSNISVAGTKWGYVFGEHVSGNQVSAAECYYAVGMKPGGHSSTFQRLLVQWCTYGITYYPYGANPTPIAVFNVLEYDMEYGTGNTGKFYNTIYAVNDFSK